MTEEEAKRLQAEDDQARMTLRKLIRREAGRTPFMPQDEEERALKELNLKLLEKWK